MPGEEWRNYKRFSNQFFGSNDERITKPKNQKNKVQTMALW
jgi:hypothetical protein